MKLIHVHGFAELEPESLITNQYRKFAKKLHWDLQIQEFKWNTLEGNLTKLVANFHESEHRVKKVAAQLMKAIAAEKEEVILSGHSLGGAVLLEALELYPKFPNLHSVILLGAAYPQKNLLSQAQNIAPRCYALNYHSPTWDLVLSQAYFNAKGHTAVGNYGLLNPGIFENVKVNCTHQGRTGYARLIPGIIGLLLMLKEFKVLKKRTNLGSQSRSATLETGTIYIAWMDILQRHSMTGHFRVIEAGGVHRERFHSKCVIPLLDAIEELPK